MTAIKNQSIMQLVRACLFSRYIALRCLCDVLAAIFSSEPNYGPFRQHCYVRHGQAADVVSPWLRLCRRRSTTT